MKFLVIRLSSVSDILFTTPVIRCLKRQVPKAQVHYLVKAGFANLISNSPYLDQVHILEDTPVAELIAQYFNYVIDLQNDKHTKAIRSLLNLPSFSYNRPDIETFIFVKFKWNVMPSTHVVDRYMETLRPFGVRNDGTGLDYFIAPQQEIKESDIPTSHLAGFIGLDIGANSKTQKLPVSKLQELCASINHPIILLGGPNNKTEGEEIRKIDPIKVYNACGKFSFNECADLVRKSKLLIAHDGGLMQVAAAFKKPVIAIWGSTSPSFGRTPYYGQDYLSRVDDPSNNIQVRRLWCRPCAVSGRHQCPLGHFKCMQKISIADIVEKVNQHLGRVKTQMPLC